LRLAPKRAAKAGTDRTQEGLDKVIGRRVAFTIHQFDAELALGIG